MNAFAGMPGAKAASQSSAEAVQGAVAEATQDGAAQEDSSAAAVQAVLSGAVAKVVFKSAVAAIPGSLSFRQSFLELLGKFRLDGLPAIRQAVLDSMKKDFGDKEECWDVQARAAAAAAGLSPAEALEAVSSLPGGTFIHSQLCCISHEPLATCDTHCTFTTCGMLLCPVRGIIGCCSDGIGCCCHIAPAWRKHMPGVCCARNIMQLAFYTDAQ